MKHLNIKATEIFCRLMDSLKGNDQIDFQLDNGEKLVLELLENEINTSMGTGQLYRLYNLFTPGENTIMKFIVLDGRLTTNTLSQVLIYPASYLKREINIFEVSISIGNGQIIHCHDGQQAAHCKHAHAWMCYIAKQAFFKLNYPQPGSTKIPQPNYYIRPLLDMTTVEKAKLLFTLCPEVTRAFLGFVLTTSMGVSTNPLHEPKWEDETISEENKTGIAAHIREAISVGFSDMVYSPELLAAELFSDAHFPFLLYCLNLYITKARNERFNRGIEFLFDI